MPHALVGAARIVITLIVLARTRQGGKIVIDTRTTYGFKCWVANSVEWD